MRHVLMAVAILGAGVIALTVPADSHQAAPAPARGTINTVASAQLVDRLREMAAPPTITSEVLVAARFERAPPQTAPKPLPSPSETLVVDAPALNLRAGPTREAEILGRLQQGDAVEVSDRKGGWVQVATAEGIVGWASADFLSHAH